MQVFDVNSQPLVEDSDVEIDLLVLANRRGQHESRLELISVLLHWTSLLAKPGEVAERVFAKPRADER